MTTSTDDVVAQLRAIEGERGEGTLRLGPRASLRVSSLGKPYFPQAGLTKGDLMRYYARVAPLLLPRIADRPLALDRYPDGVGGKSFFQQKAPEHPPAGVRVARVCDAEGDEVERVVGGALATLLYTVQLGTIPVHPWHSRLRALGAADYAVIDLDPAPRVPFPRIVEAALWVREALDAMGLAGLPKTSGSRGIHVYIPFRRRTTLEKAAAIAAEVARRVVEAHPRETTLERSLAARPKGTIYVDHLQNALGKTVVAPYSARPKPAATVSTPLRWKELTPKLAMEDFTIETVPKRVARLGDVWERG